MESSDSNQLANKISNDGNVPIHSESPDSFIPLKSKAFENVLKIAERVARFDSSVLITGETGVGKEVIARYIHNHSRRSGHSLLTINCGALPENLLESEMFGHKAGSFTGAVNDRVGLFEQAARGTILLDEIGDISLTTQVKLLRVLQEREILKIGENTPRKVDTRIIAATNRDLEQEVLKGRFREDLLYRLSVIVIEVPPLRERPEDIILLAENFAGRLMKKLNLPALRLDDECLELFKTSAWRGNVRELQNAIERAAILTDDGIIKPEHLPARILNPDLTGQHYKMSPHKTLKEVESDYIQAVLRSTRGNRAKAAGILGIGQATLWRKLKKKE